jgi:Cys-tRNA(Pro)/Cys-tRNA(Cys) deacylase
VRNERFAQSHVGLFLFTTVKRSNWFSQKAFCYTVHIKKKERKPMAQGKTNAMRILDSQKIIYAIHQYDHKDGKIDGVSVAHKIGKDPSIVYKTLVAIGASKTIFVFVIPVEKELDLKKGAKAAGEKKLEMLPVKDIQAYTGYIRGGCSPVGMRKQYRTFIDDSALELETIIVSGGKIGLQIELPVQDLVKLTAAETVPVTK